MEKYDLVANCYPILLYKIQSELITQCDCTLTDLIDHLVFLL